MAAPPSNLEVLLLTASSNMADSGLKAAEIEAKKKQLLAANKQKARMMLLGISTSSYTSNPKPNA